MIEELASPVMNRDHSVTFNFKSEHAKEIEISGEFRLRRMVVGPWAPVDSVPMNRQSNNVWNYTTEPAQPGIYRYIFVVDGIQTLDPLNPWRRYQGAAPMSMAKIDGDQPMPWDILSDIPHGTIAIEKLYSHVLEQVKSCAIYLPPSYQSSKRRYPVFYLLHGGGDDYGAWIFDGNADNIMDYLISKEKCREMVVVMPDGQVMSRSEMTQLMAMARKQTTPIKDMERMLFSKKHIDYFVKEVMPYVESRYRVMKGHRSIAGLSMGGSQTLNLITSHPGLFRAAGMFSSGGGEREQMSEKLSRVKDKLKRVNPIYVACGTWDTILDSSRMLHSLLDDLKIDHVYAEGDGGHIWSFWQRSLIDFVPTL